MAPTASQIPIERQEVARAEQRISFLYVEHATVNRDGNALTIMDQNGVVHVPATTLAALLLGPGTRITHAGVALLGDSGVSIVWVGEKGRPFLCMRASSGEKLANGSGAGADCDQPTVTIAMCSQNVSNAFSWRRRFAPHNGTAERARRRSDEADLC